MPGVGFPFQEEADCLLHLLMLAEPSQEIPGAIADRLLCRIAEAQRALNRQKLSMPSREYTPTRWPELFSLRL